MASMSRRTFLAAGLLGIAGCRGVFSRPIPGALHGAHHSLAHQRGSTPFPAPSERQIVDVAVVGGGVGGLSAARRLRRAGIERIAVLELEGEVGGNSIGGKNSVSAFPWGAHYLPIPNDSNHALLDFLVESEVCRRGVQVEYQEEFLCATPHERLLLRGVWQDGLVPQRGIDAKAEADLNRFHVLTAELTERRGRDGKFLFQIPIADSSADPEGWALDQITMRSWLYQQDLHAPELHWYVNYCCRDDYGTEYDETSAWAGLHYFCARRARPLNADGNNVLTWSEGNQWLIHRLREQAAAEEFTATLVYRMERGGDRWKLFCFDSVRGISWVVEARSVVLAIPRIVRSRLSAPLLSASAVPSGCEYAPWIVANITVQRRPAGVGVGLSWDNVVYNSSLLGYVHAQHQSIKGDRGATVLTYYYPVSAVPPDIARMAMYHATVSELQEIFLGELLKIHPELDGAVERVDLWVWGHAMIRPIPGLLSGRSVTSEQLPEGVFAAHSDQSGISIFEEAFYQGIRSAERVMRYLRVQGDTWLA